MRLLTIIIFCSLLLACGSDNSLSPEEQVKQTLSAIEEAVEARTLSGVMDYISDDYQDHRGNIKQDLKRIVQVHFIRNQNINIFSNITSLDVSDNTAAIELSALMAAQGTNIDQNNWPKADTHQFSIVLSNVGGQWLVTSVSWR